MYKEQTAISDSIIFSHLGNTESKGWQLLIDKYAPMMYGTIYQLTRDEELTREILEAVFTEINKPEIIAQMQVSPGIFLFHFTHSFTTKYLKNKNMDLLEDNYELYNNFPLLKLLFCDKVVLKEAAEKLNISINDVGAKLREESNRLRISNAFNNLQN